MHASWDNSSYNNIPLILIICIQPQYLCIFFYICILWGKQQKKVPTNNPPPQQKKVSGPFKWCFPLKKKSLKVSLSCPVLKRSCTLLSSFLRRGCLRGSLLCFQSSSVRFRRAVVRVILFTVRFGGGRKWSSAYSSANLYNKILIKQIFRLFEIGWNPRRNLPKRSKLA